MAAAPLTRSEVEQLLADPSASLAGASLAGVDLSGLDFSKRDLSSADLQGAHLEGANLSDARLPGAKMRDAVLFESNLQHAELLAVDARGANFQGCDATGAGFGAAVLEGARFFEAKLEGAALSRARLAGADLRCAGLQRARLHECDLAGADLSHADLTRAELDRSRVAGVSFDGAILCEARMTGMQGFEGASFIDADLRDTDFRGAYRLRRHIIDENYLHEFRSLGPRHELIYKLWWLSSDCGRSFGRWAAWTLLVVAVFAGAYEFVNLDYGDHPTPLSSVYFSVVTLTTLGYGDVTPASTAAQVVAMLEVVVGYLALGGLISIFANKMARRGD